MYYLQGEGADYQICLSTSNSPFYIPLWFWGLYFENYISFFSLVNRLYFFYSNFRFTQKLSIKYREFPYIPCLHTHRVSTAIHIPHKSDPSLISESTRTHHQSSQITLGFIHSWCYSDTFYEGFFFLFFFWLWCAPISPGSSGCIKCKGRASHPCQWVLGQCGRPAKVWLQVSPSVNCHVGQSHWQLAGDLLVVHGDLECHHIILLTLILLPLHWQHHLVLHLFLLLSPHSSICCSPGILVSFKVPLLGMAGRSLLWPSAPAPPETSCLCSLPSLGLWIPGMCAQSLGLCLTLCNPRVCSPPDSSVQEKILEWVGMSSSKRSSQPRD